MAGDRTGMRLVIDVEYGTGRTTLRELERVLVDAAEHLADNGLLSGDTEADVVTWNATVHRMDTGG